MGSVKGAYFLQALLLLMTFGFSGVVQGQTLQLDPNRIFDELLPRPRVQAAPVPSGPKVVYQGFMYVEPNQMRFEVLLDATSAQKAVEMAPSNSLDAKQREALKAALEAKASSWCQVVDKLPLAGVFKGVTFMASLPGEGESEPLSEEAQEDIVVGLSWSFPLSSESHGLDLHWKGYLQDQKELPIQIFYGGETESVSATEEVAALEWRPDGRLPVAMPLLPVPSLNLPPPWRLPLASILCFSGGLFIFLWCVLRRHQLPGGSLAFFSAWFLGALVTWPMLVIKVAGSLEEALPTQPAQAERIVTPLLRNVYRSYDQGSETKILSLLPRSLAGEIVLPTHGDVSSDLQVSTEPTAPRLRLVELTVKVDQPRPNPKGTGFIVNCSYQGKADGLYWGEEVEKEFAHKVEVHVSAVEGEWKIAKIEKTP